MSKVRFCILVAGTLALTTGVSEATGSVPDLKTLVSRPASELRDVLERYSVDRSALRRRHDVEHSPARRERFRAFYTEWRAALAQIEFESLGQQGRIDYILFRNHLSYRLRRLDREQRIFDQTTSLIPFAATIIGLQETRRAMETIDPEVAAGQLKELEEAIESAREAVTAEDDEVEPVEVDKTLAHRAAKMLDDLQETLEDWFDYYNGYDPLFTWWVEAPYNKADEALEGYAEQLREEIVGVKEGEDPPIVGDPIGREALLSDLAGELIPYTPEELVAVAHREFAWCEREMLKASRELGFGDDWRAALEHVKTLHVEPGRQSGLIRDQAREAIDFLEEKELLTVPPLAKEVWRIEMLSPERQKISPFFLGGEVIQVSFPTNTMSHEDKLMSMRGNNIHFARATVHHELIPGHHLQGFMTSRHNSHRRIFSTPFWGEGWALYWEMLLWDHDFPQSPENRIGMLFWRSHRCARIIFSLGFHLGTMTPQECIDFLVDRVGHERANAKAEVRRSFEGSYSPLYQLAYMMGGLQFRALHEEFVKSGEMSDREFHDAILQLGRIPVEMVRAALSGEPLARDFESRWRFAGDLEE